MSHIERRGGNDATRGRIRPLPMECVRRSLSNHISGVEKWLTPSILQHREFPHCLVRVFTDNETNI